MIGEGGLENCTPYPHRAGLSKFSGGKFIFSVPGENSRLGRGLKRGDNVAIWKEISINSNYLVSDTGKVRRRGAVRDHSVRDRKGYPSIDLYSNGERVTRRVHRLVAEAFIPNPDNKPEVNHIDGNKHNNHVSNLEWVTSKENCRHAWDSGLGKPSYSMRGRSNPNAGRKGKPIRIVETGEIFDRLKDCEEAIDGNNRHINDCLRGRQKTHRGYHFEYVDDNE